MGDLDLMNMMELWDMIETNNVVPYWTEYWFGVLYVNEGEGVNKLFNPLHILGGWVFGVN